MTSGNQLANAGNKGWALRGNADSAPFNGQADSLGFEFWNGTNATLPLTLQPSGNVGIGAANPQGTLEVSNSATPASLWLTGGNCGSGGFTCLWIGLSGTSNGYASLQGIKASGTAWGNLVLNSSGGNVGIGTTSPQHLLHVAGTIGAEEVIVSSTGADYVFEPEYHLTRSTK
jgi:hypothetical protein